MCEIECNTQGVILVTQVSVHWAAVVRLCFSFGNILYWEKEVEIKQNNTVANSEMAAAQGSRLHRAESREAQHLYAPQCFFLTHQTTA